MAESVGSHQVSSAGQAPASKGEQLEPMSATLRLTRHIGGVAFASQRWPIVIDRKIVGSIGHGETVDLNIEPGRHTLLGLKTASQPRTNL